MASRVFTISLNEDDPRHAEIIAWIDSFATPGKYRSRAVTMQIAAVLYDHIKKTQNKTRSTKAEPNIKKRDSSKKRKDQVDQINGAYEQKTAHPTLPSTSITDIDSITSHEDHKVVEGGKNTEVHEVPKTRKRASLNLSAVIKKNAFKD